MSIARDGYEEKGRDLHSADETSEQVGIAMGDKLLVRVNIVVQ